MGYLLAGLAGAGNAASEIADKYIDEAFEQRRQANLERIANARDDKQRGQQVADRAEDRANSVNDKAEDRRLAVGDMKEGRTYQEGIAAQDRTNALDDEARRLKNDKDFFLFKKSNTPEVAKDQWQNNVDKDGNVVSQTNLKNGYIRPINADGSKAGKDNIVKIPLDIDSDIDLSFNESTGEYLDPTGALTRPRGTPEDVADIVDKKISSINRLNGSDGEFAEHYKGAVDSAGNAVTTEKQARAYETEQALASTSYAAQYGVPVNQIVKQWSTTTGRDQQAPSQNTAPTMKIGGVTIPEAAATAGPTETGNSTATTKNPAESQDTGGMLSKADQNKADIALLESNGIKTAEEEKGRGYFELTDESGKNYNPAIEAGKSAVSMMEENRPLNLAVKAKEAVSTHFDKLDEASKRRATETSARAIDKLKAGKPLNSLEIKAIKEVPQTNTENKELVAAWLRVKNL